MIRIDITTYIIYIFIIIFEALMQFYNAIFVQVMRLKDLNLSPEKKWYLGIVLINILI